MTDTPFPKPIDLPLTPLRIAIVEDDPLMRMGLMQFLEAQPQIEIVSEAADGYGAIDAVSQIATDLVIMDVGLPQLDGIEATRQIKNYDSNAKIIIVTSYDEPDLRQAATEAGAIGYVVKEDLSLLNTILKN